MSYLREIMQKLAGDSTITAIDRDTMAADARELLKLHVDSYQAQLERCSKAMLQYEWAWWKEHIESLQLCLNQEHMGRELGGNQVLQRLLEESKECQSILEDAMNSRMVNPAVHSHPIVPSEHAWEVSQESIKSKWDLN